MVYPRAIARSPVDGSIYVVDRNALIQRFDQNGTFLNAWRLSEWSQGKPVGLTVAPDGNLWVPDTHYHRILVFKPEGKEIRRFGTRGSGPGEFDLPTDVAFDQSGNIYISEYGDNNRIQVFDRDLNFLRGWGQIGTGPLDFARPQSIAIVDDRLYIADACNHRIAVYSLDGNLIQHFGRSGGSAGEYRFPYGLELDADQNLIITEFGNNRLQKIDRATGQATATWGTTGRLPGELNYPWAAVASNGKIIVADAGNNRLQVFRFGAGDGK
jgi:DNA-binding beta-propeller fold protein YncE